MNVSIYCVLLYAMNGMYKNSNYLLLEGSKIVSIYNYLIFKALSITSNDDFVFLRINKLRKLNKFYKKNYFSWFAINFIQTDLIHMYSQGYLLFLLYFAAMFSIMVVDNLLNKPIHANKVIRISP